MAAVTVEDCLEIVPNRFELVLLANYRARQLMNGSPVLYTTTKTEKNTVIALREIAANLLDVNIMKEEIRETLKRQSLFKNYDDSSNDTYNEEDVDADSISDEDTDDVLNDDAMDKEDEEYYNNLTDEVNDSLDDE